MKRHDYIFTNKKHSQQAIMSVILGVISLGSMAACIYLSYLEGGVMHGGYGVAGVLAMLYSIAGLILGILPLQDKNNYRFFPIVGIVLNVLSLAGLSLLLYLGTLYT